MSTTNQPAKRTQTHWVIAEDTDLESQAQQLLENRGTTREWTSIGIEDEDGFAEVVALAHPDNAPIIALAGTAANAIDAETEYDGQKCVENLKEAMELIAGCLHYGTGSDPLNRQLAAILAKCKKETKP